MSLSQEGKVIAGVDGDAASLRTDCGAAGPACEAERVGAAAGVAGMALAATRSGGGRHSSRPPSGSRFRRIRLTRARGGRRAAWCALAAVLALLFSTQAALADTRPPQLAPLAIYHYEPNISAEVDLIFDEDLDRNSVPAKSAFRVVVDGANMTVTGVALNVTRVAPTVRLTLSPPRPHKYWFRVTYSPPATNPLQDEAGNDVAAFSATFGELPPPRPPPPPPPAVPAPTRLTATAVSYARIDLAWRDNSGNETGFRVQRRTGDSADWEEVATTESDATAFSDLGLQPETRYRYRVQAFNDTDSSPFSNQVEATTPPPAVPAPTGLTATAVSYARIDLAWRDNSGNETGFRVQRRTGDSADWEEVATTESDATAFSDLGLQPETRYVYRLQAFNDTDSSPFSNQVEATTPPPAVPAPTGLTATAVSYAQIDLAWRDNSGNETGFRVQRRTGDSADWEEVGTTEAGATAFSDLGLQPETRYRYRVQAFNDTGSSPFSNQVEATTPPPAVPAPTGLTATPVSYAQIDLAWRDNSGNETGFRVQRRTGDSADWEEVATTEADATAFSDPGLQPETRYVYRVQAFNDTDSSPFSNQAEATTPAAPEPTLTDFTPGRGPVGTGVTLTGTDFLGDVDVRFNGVSALEVEVLSTTSLEAIVPPEATSGPISVETVGGTAVSTEVFTVTTGIRSRLFVPIVLSSKGRTAGSFFTSEMTLTNRGTTRADIAYTYRAAFGGGSGTAVDALEPGRQQVIPDAIAYLTGLGIPIGEGSAGGTLGVDFSNLSSPEVAAVTVRVGTPVEEGRAGLAYPGLNRDDLLAGSAFITGLRHNGQDRSNLAVQNAGDESEGNIIVRVTVFSGDPAPADRSLVLPDLSLPPGRFHQYNNILKEAGIENGYAKVERVEGAAPYYAYGVINDQVNSDGSFVFPVREDALVGKRGQTLPVIIETNDFSSELTVTNFSAVAKRVDFRFVAEAVETDEETAGFSLELEAGEQRILPGIIDRLRRQEVAGIGPADRAYVGAVFATVAEGDMSGVVMGARTGSPARGGGHYSLFYSGVPYGSASVESAWIYGLQQNGENRSNLALVNTGEIDDSDSSFEIDIYDGGGETRPRTRRVSLGPRRWFQLNGILGATGQGYVQVRKVSGSNPFVAYGVINDGARPGQRSGDGAFLLSRP